MKVVNGKLEPKKQNNDVEFRKILKKVLKEWFDLRLEDLPTIIKKIGIKEQNYEIELISSYDERSNRLRLNLILESESIRIEMMRGDMVNPYSCIAVYGKEYAIYSLERSVKIEKIFPAKLTKEQKEKAKRLHRELMEGK